MHPLPDATTSDARERLLAAALDVFAEHGYAGASVRAICRRADANGAALNYHWGSKARLWAAVAERCGDFFLATVQPVLARGGSPAALLEGAIGALFDALVADPRPIRVVLWATLHAEEMDYEGTARAFDPLVELTLRTVRGLQAVGLVDPEVDVEVMVPLLHGQVVYAFADRAGHRRFYGADLSDPAHAARVKRALLRTVRCALGVRADDPEDRR
ncbi:MAG TPA: TetR family transcriptional regulator [Sandaracinaceae bacterium LLY-WYZ-13_1]|nr:TetR family transcriptional regulator [Sandaracinaceae bacterium LLY-WYZ-13_1]